MATRTCTTAGCAVSLEGRDPRTKYCTTRCGQRDRNGLPALTTERRCAFEGCTNSISHMAAQARFCAESCRSKSTRPRPPKKCVECGAAVARTHGNVRYCTPKCAKAAKNATYYARHKSRLLPQRAEYRSRTTSQIRERNSRYYREVIRPNPVKVAARRQYNREYCRANGEAIRAYGAWYRATYPEKWKAKNAAWLAANPDKRRDYRTKRRALELEAFVEAVDRRAVWDRDGGVCHICGEAANRDAWDLDHIIPLSPQHGEPRGEHSYANTAVSHPSCNRSKGNKPWSGGKALTAA